MTAKCDFHEAIFISIEAQMRSKQISFLGRESALFLQLEITWISFSPGANSPRLNQLNPYISGSLPDPSDIGRRCRSPPENPHPAVPLVSSPSTPTTDPKLVHLLPCEP